MDNGSAPATKADIAALDAKISSLDGKIGTGRPSLEEKIELVGSSLGEKIDLLRSEVHYVFHELRETIRHNHAELLRAFYSCAQSVDARLKEGEVADFLILGRLTAMESRQTDMERRLNTPPGQ